LQAFPVAVSNEFGPATANHRSVEPRVALLVPNERDTWRTYSAIQKCNCLANELAVVLKNATMASVGEDAECGIG
jgi:hypothetical protein